MSATTESKIRKQVEFYFSDSNLPFDKYLWEESKKNDGWIPIKTIANFKKMKMISEDLDTVVAALKAEPSDLIEVNDEQQIRRKTEVKQQDHESRSIYAKPFAIETATEDSTADLLNLQDEIQDFFEQHGKVLCVRMRKENVRGGAFKGSVFVEFSTPEEAEKVAAMDLEFKGNKLDLKTKAAYKAIKAEQYKDAPPSKFRSKFRFNAFKENQHQGNKQRGGKRGHSDKAKKDDSKRQRTEEDKAEATTEDKAEAEQ